MEALVKQIEDLGKDLNKSISEKTANLLSKEELTPISEEIAKAMQIAKDSAEKVAAIDKAIGAIGMQNKPKTDLLTDISKGIGNNIQDGVLKSFKVGNTATVHQLLKTAGTMTVADDLLAGSSVTTYSNRLEAIPSRAVNFRNLVAIAPSATGTFQFPRERAKEGSIAAQTAGAKKSIINARFEMVTVTTSYLAGLAPVAKQMLQDLPFVQAFMPQFMLREYLFAEDSSFYTTLSDAATGSTIVAGTPNDVDQIMGLVSNLRVANYIPNGIVLNPADVYKIFINKASTSGLYSLPPGVTISESGLVRIFGIPVFESTFIPEDKVLVGDWTKAAIVQTDGLSISTDDKGDNFDNNTVTWKVEARVALAVLQPAAFVFADLGNVS
jgi:HK97 family phage major capsid protein